MNNPPSREPVKPEHPQHRVTAAQALVQARALPRPTIHQLALMEQALAEQRDPKRWRDPWQTH